MGKLAAAFLFFVTSAAFAVHEARAPLPSHVTAEPAAIEPQTSDRVNVPELPDSARYARPFYVRPLPPPTPPPPPPITIEARRTVTVEVSDGPSGDFVDERDRCPDQLQNGESEDGCPEPDRPVYNPIPPRAELIFD